MNEYPKAARGCNPGGIITLSKSYFIDFSIIFPPVERAIIGQLRSWHCLNAVNVSSVLPE